MVKFETGSAMKLFAEYASSLIDTPKLHTQFVTEIKDLFITKQLSEDYEFSSFKITENDINTIAKRITLKK